MSARTRAWGVTTVGVGCEVGGRRSVMSRPSLHHRSRQTGEVSRWVEAAVRPEPRALASSQKSSMRGSDIPTHGPGQAGPIKWPFHT